MFYADTVGLKKVYERICEFEQQHGKIWTPSPLLKRLAEEGKRFSDLSVRGLSVPAEVSA
jgi:3-hydroxyacyl-CoA dehydrogenase